MLDESQTRLLFHIAVTILRHRYFVMPGSAIAIAAVMRETNDRFTDEPIPDSDAV